MSGDGEAGSEVREGGTECVPIARARAHFSVSATRNCVRPSLETVSPKPFDMVQGAKTIGLVKAEL